VNDRNTKYETRQFLFLSKDVDNKTEIITTFDMIICNNNNKKKKKKKKEKKKKKKIAMMRMMVTTINRGQHTASEMLQAFLLH
jgi:hypothetical protein